MNQVDKSIRYSPRVQSLSNRGVLPLLGIFMPTLLFCALALDVKKDVGYAFDTSFLLALHSYTTPLLDRFASMVSASVTVVSLLIIAALIIRRSWHGLLFWLLAVGGSALLNNVVKSIVERDRPNLWTLTQASFSFPSGHAMQAMTLALALVFLLRGSRHLYLIVCGAMAFVLLVGMSRMYLGLHYPSDIAGSCLLSLAWVTSVIMLFDQRRVFLDATFSSPLTKFPHGKPEHN